MDAASVTTARTVIRAPQLQQCFTSMSKVRRNNVAQSRRAPGAHFRTVTAQIA